ncbi:hypothetical protein M5689_011193 [Euphorbia peplus]|nr:hypothetical protein M5689_011193 [Euphorbia peplus]
MEEEGGSILDAIYEDLDDDAALDELDDVEMLDVEDGEITQHKPSFFDSHHTSGDADISEAAGNQTSLSRNGNKKIRKKRRKNKGGGGSGSSATKVTTSIDWFVRDTCRRLREKKSYMVYTAVGCLGLSRLTDLVNEVYAVQSCGGQMTADGGRSRTGGGILWNIMKTKEPMAYKEIMKKVKEFEKQFKPQNIRQAPQKNKDLSSKQVVISSQQVVISSDGLPCNVPVDCQLEPQNQHEQSSAEKKRISVRDRIRVPVAYDDLDGDDSKNDSAISEKLTN